MLLLQNGVNSLVQCAAVSPRCCDSRNRLWLAGTLAQPDGIWAKSADYFNFDNGDAEDNDALDITASIVDQHYQASGVQSHLKLLVHLRCTYRHLL